MGIPGLLQGLRFATTHSNIHEFKGRSVCVDGSSWLHKSVYSIAEHYVEAVERGNGGGGLDARCVAVASAYVRSRCEELLRYAEVRCVYFVLDGKRCPLKAGTNAERERRRAEYLREARRQRAAGDGEGAFEKYKNCIKATVELAKAVARNLACDFKNGSVQVVWAPYEADPQLVKLCLDGHCDAIITEDSDVLVYCAAVRQSVPVIFKFDRKTGSCQVITMTWLLCPETNLSRRSTTTDGDGGKKKKSTGIESHLEVFAAREARQPGFGARLFVQACILAGCDYAINELEGVGLVNAFKAIRGAIHRNDDDRFRHALMLLPPKACESIDKVEYEELLAKSEAVFYQHPVIKADGKVVHLLDAQENHPHFPSLDRFGDNRSFIGQVAPDEPEPLIDRTNTSPPVSEVNITHKEKRHRSRKDDESEYIEGLKRATEIVPVLNPYGKSKKRGHENVDKENSVPTKKKNPFASFMAKKPDKENDEKLTCHTQQRDYRFVRPPEKLDLNLKSFWFSNPSEAGRSKPTAHAGASHYDLQSSLQLISTGIVELINHDQPEIVNGSNIIAGDGLRLTKQHQHCPTVNAGHLSQENRFAQANNNPSACFSFYSEPNDPSTLSGDRGENKNYTDRYDSDIGAWANVPPNEQFDIPDGRSSFPTRVVSTRNILPVARTNRQVKVLNQCLLPDLLSNITHHQAGVDESMSHSSVSLRDVQSNSTFADELKNFHFPRRVTADFSPGTIDVDEDPRYQDTDSLVAGKNHLQPAFEYDDWLESPRTKGQSEAFSADDIMDSPEPTNQPYCVGLIQRNLCKPAIKTIGPIKKFRNRYSRSKPGKSAATKSGDQTRLSSRAQAKLSMFFGTHQHNS